MCNIEKNRINDLINKGQIKELDDYVDKYLELTKDFTSEEFFKVKREVIAKVAEIMMNVIKLLMPY